MRARSTAPVLVVDDQPETCQLLTTLLGRAGMNVLAVCGGDEARSLLEHGLEPCLLVTDQRMPEVSGLDLITLLRTRPRTERIPVVLLSAMRLAPRADPFTVILRKPLEPGAFVDLVEELLDTPTAALH